MSASAPRVFDRLTGIALPLVAISVAAGIAVPGMLWLRWYHALFLRLTAVIAVAAVVWGWGLAQYPYLLPASLSLAAGSAPTASLVAEFVVAGLAVLLVAPGFALLYFLLQRRLLTAAGTDADLRRPAQVEPALPGRAAAAPAAARHPDGDSPGTRHPGYQGDQGCALVTTPSVTVVGPRLARVWPHPVSAQARPGRGSSSRAGRVCRVESRAV